MDHRFTKDADDRGGSTNGDYVKMLMAMNHETRFRLSEIGNKGFKSLMDVLIALVNSCWGIVGNKNINLGKSPHHGRYLGLFV